MIGHLYYYYHFNNSFVLHSECCFGTLNCLCFLQQITLFLIGKIVLNVFCTSGGEPCKSQPQNIAAFSFKKHHRKVRIKYRIKLREKRQLETKRRWRTYSLLTIVGRNRGEVRKDEKEVNICTTCQPWSLWTTGGWREEGWTPAPRRRCFAASHWERERRDRGEIEGESIRKRRRTSKLLCAPAAGERGEGRRTEETYVKKTEGVNWWG